MWFQSGKMLSLCVLLSSLALSLVRSQTYPALYEWTEIARTSTDDLTTVIGNYPFTHYEYAMYYNSAYGQPHPIQFTTWQGAGPRFSIYWEYPQCNHIFLFFVFLCFFFVFFFLTTFSKQNKKK